MNGQSLQNISHQDAIKMLKSSDTLMLTVRVEEVHTYIHSVSYDEFYICDPFWEKVPLGAKIQNCVTHTVRKRNASCFYTRRQLRGDAAGATSGRSTSFQREKVDARLEFSSVL